MILGFRLLRAVCSAQSTRTSRRLIDAKTLCDKAPPVAAVMLRLLSRYVSKAAILTVPAQPVPVEKSKSRLNSKGLDR